jgi:hypothetical protein
LVVSIANDNYALAAAIVLETPIRKLLDRHEERTDSEHSVNIFRKAV